MNFFNQLLFDAKHRRQTPQLLNRRLLLSIVFMLVMASQVFAQASKTVSGTVIDGTGQTLPGVSVLVKGTTNGTVTDVKGHYSISVSASATLTFSFVGYSTAEEAVNNRTSINVNLKEVEKSLDEVVVIGYGTVRKRDLTGSVASVGGKDLAATPVANLGQAIQGKLAGVSVTTQDGRPGAGISIRVRGGGSISGSNDPLVLIDGTEGNLNDVPADQVERIDVLKDASSSAIYGARGANGVVIVTTKTPKAGKTTVSYGGYVKFNTPTKYLQALDPYDYLKYVWANTAAYGAAYQTPFEKLYGLGANAGANTGGIESYRNLPTDDIQKQLYNSSVSWNHSLTVTGGTDKTKILFSTNYSDDQGMKINSYAKRANATFKITQKLADNLTFDINTRYTDGSTVSSEGAVNGLGSVLSSAYRFRPISTAHILGDKSQLVAGNIEQYGKNSMLDSYSPVVRTLDSQPLSLNKNVNTIGSLTWGVIKGLTYHTELSLGRSWSSSQNWTGANAAGYIDDATGAKLYAGNASINKGDNWNTRWTNTLNYDFSVNKIHHFTVLAGQEVSNSNNGTTLSLSANHFPANFTKENAFAQIGQFDPVAGSISYSNNTNTPYRLSSYFGRANYSLLDRYLVALTFRADGSSRFAPDKHWGYFPAGSFAWRISEEPFLKNKVTWLDDLKFRVAFGETGNDNIGDGKFSQTWAAVTSQNLDAGINHKPQPAYDLNNTGVLANPNLKWETTITRGIGTDFTLFHDRLSGTIEGYWNQTKDLLMKTSIPGITGYQYFYDNVGQTSNKGIEVSLNGTIFQNDDWRVTASGNISFNKNNIDQLNAGVTTLYGTGWASSQTYPTSDYVLLQGHPVGLVRGLVYDGIYTTADFNYSGGMYTLKPGVPDLGAFIQVLHGVTNADKPASQFAYPGLPKFKDLDHSGSIGDGDVDVIGNMNPKHTGGFNVNVAYKNIDLGLAFNWSYGNQIYNINKLNALYGAKESGVYENKLTLVKNSYKIYDVVNGQLVRLTTPDQLNAANTNATLPLLYNEAGITSTLGIEDGSFLRLNTLTLGYTIPKAITSKVKISNLRIYGSIYNVLTVTGYSGLDPEVNSNSIGGGSGYPVPGEDYGAYPRPRSYVVGMNLNF